MTRPAPFVRACALGPTVLAAAALAQVPRQESPGGAPARPAPIRLSRPASWGGTDLSPGVQVNTGPGGLNIVGDAANEPSMTVDPTAPNRIAIGWRQFASISSNFRQAGNAYSRDGGRTWANPGALTPSVFRTDPVLDTTASGTFFYYSLFGTALTTCDLFRSDDHGATWLPPVPARGGDKNWLTIDRSSGPGHDHLYVIWSPFFSCCGPRIFARSTDLGQTFSEGTIVPESPYFGTVGVGPSGNVYVAGIRMSSSAQFAFARSSDARNPGATPTFDLSRLVDLGGVLRSNTGTGPNPGGLNGQVWVAADPRPFAQDVVYLLCTVDPPGTDPGDVMFASSFDAGATWNLPVRVNDDPVGPGAWQWMGTIGVAPDGRIDAVWIDTRATLTPNLGRVFYAFSRDGGVTWSPNQPITDQWNSFLGWPQQSKIGDYFQLVSDTVGANLIYAATFNGEQDIYFMRLGEYDCNRNGVADSLDISSGTAADCNFNGIPDSCETAAGQTVNCLCYANCDGSTSTPVLNVNDFICFQSRFAAAEPYADCDRSNSLNVNDFVCFQARYVQGCP